MKLIPAIDIRGGKGVRLYKGDFSRETVYSDDPVALALRWQDSGAQLLHVVDLDGAREGTSTNLPIIERVCSAVTIPVEVGGGLRSLANMRGTIEAGAARVVLGTAALQKPDLLAEALSTLGARIAVALDARDSKLATHGWQDTGSLDLIATAAEMASAGVRCLIYTDIGRDGTLEGPNVEVVKALQGAAGPDVEVIASGGVGKLEDLALLLDTGVSGVIIGKALYTGDIDLPEALRYIDNLRNGEQDAS